jgi:glycosyltransferase involved in cell wall biosynthesis
VTAIDRIAVIVPAYNEATSIAECLESIGAAARGVPTRVIVVADSCTDGTARIARFLGAEVIEVAVRNVGRARAAGCAYALRTGVDGLWLAHTDADSTVPATWLRRHYQYANGGTDVLAGTVEVVDWHEWPTDLRTRYEQFYAAAISAGRHHVHGCNLGVSAVAYQRIGGFAPLAVGEDRDLLGSARADGRTITYASDIAVRTSARRHARVVGGGFHSFLGLMADPA